MYGQGRRKMLKFNYKNIPLSITKICLFYSLENKQFYKKGNRATRKIHLESVPTYSKQTAS